MFPWRLGGAIALTIAFALMGREIRRIANDLPWSEADMWWSIATGAVAGGCVLGWTWFTVSNARHLVEPAQSVELPDPAKVVSAWLAPYAFIALAVGIVASLGEQISRSADEPVSSIPVLVAVACLFVSIPLTYRPLYLLSGIVRQVGGHSARLAQWMWVPVAMVFVGVGSIVALRFSGVVLDGASDDSPQWAPLWLVGVVAVAPCAIAVLLAWRAAATVEEAMQLAADRRRGQLGERVRALRSRSAPTRVGARQAAAASRRRVRLIPGVDLLRLVVATMMSGLALLTLVGSLIMYLFWREESGGALPDGRRAWDAMGVLHSGARVAGLAVIVLVSIWTFVAVTNARMATGLRRNPIVAALSWPLVAAGIWTLADRASRDERIVVTIVALVAQAALLYVPFRLLERTAEAVGARRSPLRVAYAVGIALLVYLQTLGGLTTIEESADANYGRLAGFLALAAMLELLATLPVTEACRAIEDATDHEAAGHNALVDQREAVARRHAAESSPAATPGPRVSAMGNAP